METANHQLARVSTGISALDEIAHGGLPKGEMYVVNGSPGTGKTILALHFLEAGAQAGETSLFVAISQRLGSIHQTADSVGIDTTNIVFREFDSAAVMMSTTQQQTVFDTSEVELADAMTELLEIMASTQPQRVVFDGIAYLRMLANNPVIYRQQLMTLRDYLAKHDVTVVLTDTEELAPGDHELVSIAYGVLSLSRASTGYSSDYRYLQINKIRGSDFDSGIHDLEITAQGMRVYPLHRQSGTGLLTQEKIEHFKQNSFSEPVESGEEQLDDLIGGSLLTGTSSLLIGPSGTGKTSIATLFANNFVGQGGKASVFLFDELASTFLTRSQDLGMEHMTSAQVRIHEIGLGDVTPGKFSSWVEHDVTQWGARIVIIDSLTGYMNSMPDTRKLFTQMHELLIELSRQNVLTMLVVAQHGVIGSNLEEGVDISYLADTVLLLRHFEADGALHRAIGVYKKRYGRHEMGIREIKLGRDGISIGPPLDQFTGILSGIPNYVGESRKLIKTDDPTR